MASRANKPIMIVELNTGGANHLPVQPAATRLAVAEAAAAADAAADASVSFSTQALQDTLKQSSQVRPEKVAQASALVTDVNYPSDGDLNRLAGLLAKRL
jgi:hypothetical protein